MVRLLFAFLLSVSLLSGDVLDEKIANLIDEGGYVRHKKLIEKIFSDRSEFYTGDRLDVNKIAERLKENGLLKLFFNEPKELKITYITNSSPVLATTIVSNALKSMGYLYFVAEDSSLVNNQYKQTIILDTEHVVDPVIFINELKKRGSEVINLRRINELEWEYLINTDNGRLYDASYLFPNENVTTSLGANDHFFEVDGEGYIEIKSKAGNFWHPFIVFFTPNLNVIDIKSEESRAQYRKIKLPKGTRYIKISDFFTKSNIKNGFIVKFTTIQ